MTTVHPLDDQCERVYPTSDDRVSDVIAAGTVIGYGAALAIGIGGVAIVKLVELVGKLL